MAEVAYAVHTRSCSYLLDEGGVCRWIISPTGMVPVDVRRCMGAQFVACLEARHPGQLVGELVLGANALFVKLDEDTGRMMLLRTAAIEDVEFNPEHEDISMEETFGSDDELAPLTEPVETVPRAPRPPAQVTLRSDQPGPPRRSAPAPAPVAPEFEDSYLDPDELVQYDEESTVTLTMPLFRPEVQARYLAGRRNKPGGQQGEAPPAPLSTSEQDTLRTPRRPGNRKPWPE